MKKMMQRCVIDSFIYIYLCLNSPKKEYYIIYVYVLIQSAVEAHFSFHYTMGQCGPSLTGPSRWLKASFRLRIARVLLD